MHHNIFCTLTKSFPFEFIFLRYIYFTVTGISPRILRADMDGKNPLVLANVSSIRGTTLDIALDKVNNRLFYSDEGNNMVKYINLTSGVHHAVLYGNPRRPVGLALFNGTLYWTGEGTVELFSGGIYKVKADTLNGGIVREVVDLLSYPKGIYAHDARMKIPAGGIFIKKKSRHNHFLQQKKTVLTLCSLFVFVSYFCFRSLSAKVGFLAYERKTDR